MKHLLTIKKLDWNLERSIPEDVIFDTDRAHLLYEHTEKSRFLWFPLKDYHRKLYITANGAYVIEEYHDGEKSEFSVISKREAGQFVKGHDKDAYMKLFNLRVL